ncbi:unnamed protein product [Ectocarpus fasciculatus]
MDHAANAVCSCGAAGHVHRGSSRGGCTETWASRRVVTICAAAALVVALTVRCYGTSTESVQHQDRFGDGGLGEYRDQGASTGGRGVARGRSLREFTKQRPSPPRCFVLEGEDSPRCHANVYFFGMSKCGTTSLAHWMARHPSLRWVSNTWHTRQKEGGEAHVMEMGTIRDNDSVYALTAPMAAQTDTVIDYTPHYSILADVPYRIKEMYGKASYDGTVKYIAVLREPVTRTISSWQFKYDLKGVEKGEAANPSSERRSLEEAFSEGREHVLSLVKCLSDQENDPPNDIRNPGALKLKIDLHTCHPRAFLEDNMYFSHVGKSMYSLQLERWLDLFGRENVKVVFLEEMAVDPVGTIESVLDFVGVDLLDEREGIKGLGSRKEWEEVVRTNHNLTSSKKKKILDEQVTPEILQSMRDFFAPFNTQLEELLGRPLPDNWSKDSTPSGRY